MDLRWISRPAVGGVLREPRVRRPAAGLVRALVLGLLVLVVPTRGAGPVGAMAPDSPPLREPSAHSSPELGLRVGRAHDGVQAALVQPVTRTRRPDRIVADLGAAQARLADANDEVARAASELEAQDEAAGLARRAARDARAARADAQAAVTAAEQAMTAASERLAELMAASEAAASARALAEAQVQGLRVGTKAHRVAFTSWQMAAIADRAAQARQAVAKEAGTATFERLRGFAVSLAEAETALTAARSARAEAEQTAQASTARLAVLEARRRVLVAAVDSLTAEAAVAAGSQVRTHPSGGGPS